jgi:hypothetical protein
MNTIQHTPAPWAVGNRLLEDHKRMFPEVHPHSTIKWDECIEVKAATAAIAKAKGGGV